MRTPDEIAAEIEGLVAKKRRQDQRVEDYGSAVDADLKFADAAVRLLPEAAAALRARPDRLSLDKLLRLGMKIADAAHRGNTIAQADLTADADKLIDGLAVESHDPPSVRVNAACVSRLRAAVRHLLEPAAREGTAEWRELVAACGLEEGDLDA